MKRKLNPQRIVALLLAALALALLGVGIYGSAQRTGSASSQITGRMRIQALLDTTGAGAVEAIVAAAKKEAVAAARAEGGGMAAIREASAKAEEEARATAQNLSADLDAVDTTELSAAALELEAARSAYFRAYDAALEEYRQEQLALQPETAVTGELEGEAADGLEDAADDLALEEETQVDLSGFTPTEELFALSAVVDEKFVLLGEALKGIYPQMDDETLVTLKETLLDIVYRQGDTFATQYDRLAAAGGLESLENKTQAQLARMADTMLVAGVGLILLALVVWFYQPIVKFLGVPRLIIGLFFVALCLISVALGLSLPSLFSNTLVRLGMNSILVLAMLPGIQCGISLNLGLPLGIIGGLLGALMSIEFGLAGFGGFFFSIAVGSAFAAVLGYLYALLLNRLKGSEMAVTTYVGFSIVSLMCIFWLILPFKSPVMRWPMGNGLRVTINLAGSYRKLLNDFLAFEVFGVTVPTGLLLFMALMCLLVWLFTRTKTGIAMQSVGNNARFAEATGISENRMRVIGTVLSTVLGAIGIIVYSSSYGFIQLYTAPRQMGFVAASAILIGGATTARAKITNVIIGTFLFQGVLALGVPVANQLLPSSAIAETMRILISNGIILYALTKSGGKSRA